MRSLFVLVFLFGCMGGARAQVTFTNSNPSVCFKPGWIDLAALCGAQPAGGYWTMSSTIRPNCCDSVKTSPTYGMVDISCLGVNGKGLNPAQWLLTYVYTDQLNQTSTGTVNLIVKDLTLVMLGADVSICYNAPSLELHPFPNTGSDFEWLVPPCPPTNISHPSLSNPILEFNAGPKTHIFYPGRGVQDTTYMLVYRYTNPSTQCSNTDTVRIYVAPVPAVNAGTHAGLCGNDAPFNLSTMNGVSPAGGTWSGAGVTNGMFDPKAPGVQGANVMTYTAGNAFGCSAADTMLMVVHALPNTQFTLPVAAVCETYPPFQFNGTPSGTGGSYFLNGQASGDVFVPYNTSKVLYMPDSNIIEYRYTDTVTGCTKSVTRSLQVQHAPLVKITGSGPYIIGQPFQLKGVRSYTATWQWSRTGDGVFTFGASQGSVATTDSVGYIPGSVDLAAKTFRIILSATDTGICNADHDTLTVGIWPAGIGTAGAIQVRVYPNPSDGKLFVELNDGLTHTFRFSDLSGRVLHTLPLERSSGIDLARILPAKGVYLLQVDNTSWQKLVYR